MPHSSLTNAGPKSWKPAPSIICCANDLDCSLDGSLLSGSVFGNRASSTTNCTVGSRHDAVRICPNAGTAASTATVAMDIWVQRRFVFIMGYLRIVGTTLVRARPGRHMDARQLSRRENDRNRSRLPKRACLGSPLSRRPFRNQKLCTNERGQANKRIRASQENLYKLLVTCENHAGRLSDSC